MSSRNDLLMDIASERVRQDKQWGEQNHPSIGNFAYEIPSELRARHLCDTAAGSGKLTWAHIAVEELSEAVCAKSGEDRVKELTQLAAVCVAWAESIRRNNEA